MQSIVRTVLACLLVFAACAVSGDTPPSWPAVEIPATRAVDVVDDYHGTKIADPYRWLEDQDGEATAAWVATQNRATEAVLAAMPEFRR